MFGIDVIAIIALVVVAWRQQQRLHALQRDVDALRKAFVGEADGASVQQAAGAATVEPQAALAVGPWSTQATARESPAQIDTELTDALAAASPEQAAAAAAAAEPQTPGGPPAPPAPPTP